MPIKIFKYGHYKVLNRFPCAISAQFNSVAQSSLTLCNPMDCSTPGFPVLYQLPELAQTHVHWSVMPLNHLILCRPLLLPPSIYPNIRVFSNESVLHIRWPKSWSFNSTLVLPMNIQDLFPLGWTGWISLLSKGLSRIFSSTVQKHQFFSAQSNAQNHTWLLEKS